MNIYVAGRTNMTREVRVVQECLRNAGHYITHDWTRTVEAVGGAAKDDVVPPQQQRMFAERDLRGVVDSQGVVAVCGPRWCGTLIEIGYGLANHLPVILYGEPEIHSVFWHLANVHVVKPAPHFLLDLLEELAPPVRV